MCQLFESIRLEDGRLQHLDLHEARMARSRQELWGITEPVGISGIAIPEDYKRGLFKCRVTYKDVIDSVEFLPYGLRKIKSVKLVIHDTVEYQYKYLDRSQFQEMLLENINYDEILIVKNGLLTDSTFSNLAFFDGSAWYTPDSPLLSGTRRQFLLDTERIAEMRLRPEDLSSFSMMCFINAMLDLGQLTFPCGMIVH